MRHPSSIFPRCHAIQAFDRRRHRLGCLIVTDTFPRKNQARPEKNLLQNRHERRGIKLPDIAILQNHRKTSRNRGKIDDGCRIHCHRLQRGSRSFFLHRLRVLGISFATQAMTRQDNATWAEHWSVRWTPEAEIELVEAALKGDTVAQAASFCMKERVEQAPNMGEALAGLPLHNRKALYLNHPVPQPP